MQQCSNYCSSSYCYSKEAFPRFTVGVCVHHLACSGCGDDDSQTPLQKSPARWQPSPAPRCSSAAFDTRGLQKNNHHSFAFFCLNAFSFYTLVHNSHQHWHFTLWWKTGSASGADFCCWVFYTRCHIFFVHYRRQCTFMTDGYSHREAQQQRMRQDIAHHNNGRI